MKLSVNKLVIDKDRTKANKAFNFMPVDISPQELADHICKGHAFSYQFKGGHRKIENFLCSDIVTVDIDHGMTLEEALGHPYVLKHASIVYTTCSHTHEQNRFRIIFQCEELITDSSLVRSAQRALASKFNGDIAATDSARMSYGNTNAIVHIFSGSLSDDDLALLIQADEEGASPIYELNHSLVGAKRPQYATTRRSQLKLDPTVPVRLVTGELRLLADLVDKTPVHCPSPDHVDSRASAHTLINSKGLQGVHCASCAKSFWLPDVPKAVFDFQAFDKQAYIDPDSFTPAMYEQPPDEEQRYEVETPKHSLLNSRYIGSLPIWSGTMLVKSPKGSGKTEALADLVNRFKKERKTVLLVGHRRSLLQALAGRLDLALYLTSQKLFQGHVMHPYFACSIDSLPAYLHPKRHKYDVVLIDESEQVFSHLISSTMEATQRRMAYLSLRHYMKVAKHVVALDADLNTVTLQALPERHGRNRLAGRKLVLNVYKAEERQYELYASKEHLLHDLFDEIGNGRRIFLCSNSKTNIKSLAEAIQQRFSGVAIYMITSDNSNTPAVADFVKNVQQRILDYQVVLVSPALGTGIDISFPGNACLIDTVYGLFEPLVNTHYDIDQQLSRVRNPGALKLWISPRRFMFETDVVPIAQEIALNELVPEAVVNYLDNGDPVVNADDEFVKIYAAILASQRGSKNQLKQNFIELREYNGWNRQDIPKDPHKAAIGSALQKAGKDLLISNAKCRLLAARHLSAGEFNQLLSKERTGKLSLEERDDLEKTRIEEFYAAPLTEELLTFDDNGKGRDRLRLFEGVLSGTAAISAAEHERLTLLRVLFFSAGLLCEKTMLLGGNVITQDSLAAFSQRCISEKARSERVLGIEVRADVGSKALAQLNVYLKMIGLKAVLLKKSSAGGKAVYTYRLDEVLLMRMQFLMQQRRAAI
jgi:hypothetical protein